MLVKTFQHFVRNSRIQIIFRRSLSSAPETIPRPSTEIPDENCNTKLLKVAIIGTPNSGKSTFINNLMDRKVCATSRKVHTTRSKAMAVFTVNDSQIVFMDTPGLVNDKERKKYNLERSFVRDCKNILKESDIVGVIHDVSNIWTRERLDIKIVNLLDYYQKIPSFLVFNKIDILKSKRKLLDITRQVTENCLDGKPISKVPFKKNNPENKGWPHFREVFMISALTGDGIIEVKNYLINQAKPGKWMFSEEVWTDQSAEMLILKTTQAKLLDFLPQEIPYNLKPEIEYFSIDENGVITTVVLVRCPTERISKLVAGASDGRLKQITENIQQDLQDTFQNYVRLRIVLNS